MTVTVEVINKGSLNLLREMANLGLIHLYASARQDTGRSEPEEPPSYLRFLGCCKNTPGGSVEDFLARCREDKEHELEIKRREEEERARYAKLHS